MLSKILIKSISVTLLLSFSILLSFYIYLKSGISIESLSLANYKIEKLHLKLNSKLVLKVSSLEKSDKNISKKVELNSDIKDENITKKPILSNLVPIRKYLDKIIKVSNIFEYISLESIKFKGRKYLFSFSDYGIFYFAGDKFEFAGKLSKLSDRFNLTYPLFLLKKYGLRLNGDLDYFGDGSVNLSGKYDIADINGSYSVTLSGDLISFELNSTKTKSLKKLLNLFKMNFIVKEWLYNRIKAEKYKLIYLKGKAKIIDDKVTPLIDSIEAKIELEDLNVTFHSKLLPITAEKSTIILKNKNLFFSFKKPKYKNRAIDGSSVKLVNIHQKSKLALKLHIIYKGVMDKVLMDILKAYNINVPIKQKGGESSGILDIDIPLQKNKKVKFTSSIDINGGELVFGGKEYGVDKGKIYIEGGFIELKGVAMRLKNIKTVIDGKINLVDREAKLSLFIKSLNFPLGAGTLSIKKRRFPVKISWNKKYKLIDIPTMKTKVKLTEKETQIYLEKLSLWENYLNGLFKLIDEAKIKITTPDLKVYKIKGSIYWKSCPLCKKRKAVKKWKLGVTVSNNTLLLSSTDKTVTYNSKKRVLVIRNLNIDNRLLEKVLQRFKKLSQNSKKSRNKGKKHSKKSKRDDSNSFTVIGKNSLIFYRDYTLHCSRYTLKVIGSKKYFNCKVDDSKIDITLDKLGLKRVDIKIMSDKTLFKITNFKGIKDTRYNFRLSRYKKDSYKGKIFIRGGVIKNLKSYNDIISLFNMIPSILMFSNPGFSDKGFELKKGNVLFNLKGNTLGINTLVLEGKSSTIAGKGRVNLKTQKINMDLAIQTAREIGKAIGSIPIVGYILFGEDKSLTMSVKVKGTLKKPDIQSHPIGDTLTYPLKLLKRTLEAPLKLPKKSRKGRER